MADRPCSSGSEPVMPWWLRPTRCLNSQGMTKCEDFTTEERTCRDELNSSGEKYRVCQQLMRHFRVCAGREPEEVASTRTESCERLSPDPPSSVSEAPLSSEAGQLLEEFFALASELKDDLLRTGAIQQEEEGAKSSSSQRRGLLGRLFGWGQMPSDRIRTERPSVSPSSRILATYALPQQDV